MLQVAFDHADPSIFTVLTCPSQIPGSPLDRLHACHALCHVVAKCHVEPLLRLCSMPLMGSHPAYSLGRSNRLGSACSE